MGVKVAARRHKPLNTQRVRRPPRSKHFDFLTLIIKHFDFDFDLWRYYVRGIQKWPRTALSTLTSRGPPLGYPSIVSVFECDRKFTPG